MKIMRKILFTILVSMLAAASAFAQQTMLRSAYFMSGYNGRGDLNPAFSAERSYFSMPSLGGTALSAQSNMGVNTFLYPVDGQLTTFMSSAVSPEDFLGKLKNSNRLGVNVDMSIFSLGIWGEKVVLHLRYPPTCQCGTERSLQPLRLHEECRQVAVL